MSRGKSILIHWQYVIMAEHVTCRQIPTCTLITFTFLDYSVWHFCTVIMDSLSISVKDITLIYSDNENITTIIEENKMRFWVIENNLQLIVFSHRFFTLYDKWKRVSHIDFVDFILIYCLWAISITTQVSYFYHYLLEVAACHLNLMTNVTYFYTNIDTCKCIL